MIFIIYGNLFIKRNVYPSLHHLTVNGLQCTSRQVLFQPLSQHPVHSDCKRYASRSGHHGIADTSLWLHVHFWQPGAKRCPSKEWRRINMIRFPGEIFWTFFFFNNTMNKFRSLCTHVCVIPAKAKAQDQDHRFILQNKFILQRQY